MIFELKSDLPLATQDKIDALEAITAANRTTAQTAFLTAMAPYRTNAVIKVGEDGLILAASGLTVPTGYEGFAKGATFTKTDATGAGLYQNTGSTTSATWTLIADTDTDNNNVPSGTPVNAVAAAKVLTVGGQPSEGDTVSMGGVVYKFRAAISAGVKATKTLTLTGQPANTNTLTLDTVVLTLKTALSEVKATSTLTITGNETDGNSVTIGTTKYTFKETLGAAYDVKIGASASDTLDNLIAAINKAAGEGSTYGTGTVAHPDVSAAAGAGDTMDITAKVAGTAGNSIATTELSAVSSWTAGTMQNGANAVVNEVKIGADAQGTIDNIVAAMGHAAGEGTNYSTGTVAHATLDITKQDTDKLVATAKTVGFAGNSIAIAETMANATWAGGATALSGGVDAQAANDVLIGANAEAAIDNLVLAVTAGAGEGTNYGTGTVVNPAVTAAKTTAATMTATAKVKGVVGNDIVIAENGTNTSWAAAATKLSGGTDATVGVAGQLLRDATYLYVCADVNTIADTNWRRISLGTAY